MAEGGIFSRTLESGSEALFDHECTECRAYGLKKVATDFCQDCKEFLCNICGIYHSLNLETHTLLSVASLQQSTTIIPSIGPVPDVAKCQYHPDRDIEMYCGTHDMVYCSFCIAKEHRSCSDVEQIGDVAHKSNLSTLQSLVAEITRISKQLHTTKLEMSKDLKQIQNIKDSLQEEIKGLREQFNLQLDALEQKIMAELDEEQNKLENEIGDDITAVNDLIIASDKSKPDLMSHLNEKHTFIAEKLGQVVIADVKNFLKKASVLKHRTLKFEPNPILSDSIEKSDRMGKINRIYTISKHIQRSNYTMKSMNEINIRVDRTTCCINDMCQLPDGTILLIDFSNKNLKRLDDQLNVRDFFTLNDKPMGLCSVSSTEVAVRMEDKTIHFIYVGKSFTYKRKVSIKNIGSNSFGMVCCNNQLWIPSAGAVDVYSLSGKLVKKIVKDSQGRTLFSEYSPRSMAVSNDDAKVYVAAGGDRVVVLNNNGDVINEVRDRQLKETWCVCVTENEIVLVAGSTSMNIVMFDRDGNSLGELVSMKDMLSLPVSLCYDRERCRLLLGYMSDKAHIFQLS